MVAGLFFQEAHMTNKDKERYEGPEMLRELLERTLAGKKYKLHCNHHVTFMEVLGNDITIYNGKKLKIICSQCGH
jgi:hypothetical protein